MDKLRLAAKRTGVLAASMLILLAGSAAPAIAGQVRAVNLEEMTERAATIFRGQCMRVRHERDQALGIGVTRVTFRVQRVIKGDLAPTVEVRLLGGPDHNRQKLAGMPVFREGEEVVLFLYAKSALGLTSPVGLGQGKFTVFTDKQGRKLAINEFRNANLSRGLSADARERLGRELQMIERGDELEPTRFLDLAQKLVRKGSGHAKR